MIRARTATTIRVSVILLLAALLAGCGVIDAVATNPRGDEMTIESGEGMFTFAGYPSLANRPMRVWYFAPPDLVHAGILIVMHGVGRNAEEYRTDWEPLVKNRDVLVLVPEFTDADFPGASWYNLGNVADGDAAPRPSQEWTFQVIEALFDAVVAEVGSQARDYVMFGHSAGAQFVHRFLEFMPDHRVRTAVAANAGWYTVVDDDVKFPYGLDGAPVGDREIKSALAADLVVLLGADDIEPDDTNLRHDEQTDAQGRTRLDRGLYFYRTGRQTAAERSLPFRWRLSVVPGIGHSHTEMARAAAPLLLDSLTHPR